MPGYKSIDRIRTVTASTFDRLILNGDGGRELPFRNCTNKCCFVDRKDALLQLPQVLVTPHIAGLTDLMLNGTVNYICHVIEEFAAGKTPKSILNSPAKPRRLLRD